MCELCVQFLLSLIRTAAAHAHMWKRLYMLIQSWIHSVKCRILQMSSESLEVSENVLERNGRGNSDPYQYLFLLRQIYHSNFAI